MNPAKPVHETTMDSRTGEEARMFLAQRVTKGDIQRMIRAMSSTSQSAKLSREEPDARNMHVRVCGG